MDNFFTMLAVILCIPSTLAICYMVLTVILWAINIKKGATLIVGTGMWIPIIIFALSWTWIITQ